MIHHKKYRFFPYMGLHYGTPIIIVCILGLIAAILPIPLKPILQAAPLSIPAFSLTNEQLMEIGFKIKRNECGREDRCLISWNKNENFLSLGIGHFIWYPDQVDKKSRFQESFPVFLKFADEQHAVSENLKRFINEGCPWRSRNEFIRAKSGPIAMELRKFLKQTFVLQVQFIAKRAEKSVKKIISHTEREQDKIRIISNYATLIQTPAGIYALMDYVNFKGEGILKTERHRGIGWGLKQVLLKMRLDQPGLSPVEKFSNSAQYILKRRVINSPRRKQEMKWLKGWLARVEGYKKHSFD